jgi:hypothetical protein
MVTKGFLHEIHVRWVLPVVLSSLTGGPHFSGVNCCFPQQLATASDFSVMQCPIL